MMYFWDEDSYPPILLSNQNNLSGRGASKNGYGGMFCLNTFDGKERFGIFANNIWPEWENVEFDQMPPKFIHALIKEKAIVPTLHYYAGQLVDDSEDRVVLEGSYMLINGTWYHFVHGMNKIPIEDVPNDIRLHAALLTGQL